MKNIPVDIFLNGFSVRIQEIHKVNFKIVRFKKKICIKIQNKTTFFAL